MSRDLFLRRGWLLPLALGLFVDNVLGTPLRAAAVLSAVLWGAAVLFDARRRPSLSPASLLFLLWSAAGLSVSVYVSNTLNELALFAAAWALFCGASVRFDAHPGEKAVFARALVVLALAKAAIALSFPSEGGRPFMDPGEVGSANASLLPMFLVLAVLAGRTVPGRAWRGAWAVLLAAAVWLCVRTNAMAALLGLAAGLPLEAAFRSRRRLLFIGAAAAGAAALAVLFLPGGGLPWLRYNPSDPNRLERLAIWSDSLGIVRDHPILGTGLGTFEQYYPQYKSLAGARTANFAHNEWIQALCETGVPGLALVLFLLGGLSRALADRGRTADSPGAAAGLAALGLWACLYFVFRSDALLFTGAFFAASLLRLQTAPFTVPWRRGAAVFCALVAAVVFPQGTAQVHERLGGAAWDRGDFPRALDLFRTAARWNPLEPRFLDEQVECLRRLDRKAETLPLLARAVALKPRDVWLRRKYAVALLNLSGPAAARDAYAPILALAPNVEQFRREYQELPVPPKR